MRDEIETRHVRAVSVGDSVGNSARRDRLFTHRLLSCLSVRAAGFVGGGQWHVRPQRSDLLADHSPAPAHLAHHHAGAELEEQATAEAYPDDAADLHCGAYHLVTLLYSAAWGVQTQSRIEPHAGRMARARATLATSELDQGRDLL